MIINRNAVNQKLFGTVTIEDERSGAHKGAKEEAGINIISDSTPTIDINGVPALTLNTTVPVVLGGETQADSVAVDVAAVLVDLNALLAKLRTAGVLAT